MYVESEKNADLLYADVSLIKNSLIKTQFKDAINP